MNYARLKTLLEKLKNGQREYFEEFYNLTKSAVYYTARVYFADDFSVEDVMQDAYYSFLTNIHKVSGNPLPYLLQTVKNKALDVIKKDKRLDKTIEIESFNISEEEKEKFPFLSVLKEKLDDEEFFILERTVIMGYKRVEVAKMMNKPVSTVNRKYNSVINKIKKIYREER